MEDLTAMYGILLKKFGRQNWWPADTPFEVVVGAILTQSTSWKNVEKAVTGLKREGLLDPEGINKTNERRLAKLIRPAGYYNAKSRKLKEFTGHLYERYGGDIDSFLDQPPEKLRSELLSIWGIGPETADSILLYAANKPVFVVDAYTKRIFYRMGLVREDIDYHELKAYSQKNLPKDVQVFNEFHALLVRLGKDYCRKTKPLCAGCPLKRKCRKKSIRKKSLRKGSDGERSYQQDQMGSETLGMATALYSAPDRENNAIAGPYGRKGNNEIYLFLYSYC